MASGFWKPQACSSTVKVLHDRMACTDGRSPRHVVIAQGGWDNHSLDVADNRHVTSLVHHLWHLMEKRGHSFPMGWMTTEGP